MYAYIQCKQYVKPIMEKITLDYADCSSDFKNIKKCNPYSIISAVIGTKEHILDICKVTKFFHYLCFQRSSNNYFSVVEENNLFIYHNSQTCLLTPINQILLL